MELKEIIENKDISFVDAILAIVQKMEEYNALLDKESPNVERAIILLRQSINELEEVNEE